MTTLSQYLDRRRAQFIKRATTELRAGETLGTVTTAQVGGLGSAWEHRADILDDAGNLVGVAAESHHLPLRLTARAPK